MQDINWLQLLILFLERSHLNCLKALKRTEEIKIKQTEIHTILACHLFSPLMTDGDVILDRTCYKNQSRAECLVCKQEKGVKIGNTNYGKH